MIIAKRINIRCPKCGKMICTMAENANPSGIFFWCPRCKKEFELEKKLFRALEANDR